MEERTVIPSMITAGPSIFRENGDNGQNPRTNCWMHSGSVVSVCSKTDIRLGMDRGKEPRILKSAGTFSPHLVVN